MADNIEMGPVTAGYQDEFIQEKSAQLAVYRKYLNEISSPKPQQHPAQSHYLNTFQSIDKAHDDVLSLNQRVSLKNISEQSINKNNEWSGSQNDEFEVIDDESLEKQTPGVIRTVKADDENSLDDKLEEASSDYKYLERQTPGLIYPVEADNENSLSLDGENKPHQGEVDDKRHVQPITSAILPKNENYGEKPYGRLHSVSQIQVSYDRHHGRSSEPEQTEKEPDKCNLFLAIMAVIIIPTVALVDHFILSAGPKTSAGMQDASNKCDNEDFCALYAYKLHCLPNEKFI